MSKRLFAFCISLSLLSLSLCAGPLDAGDPKEIVNATLIADSTAVEPGGPLMLGVLYKVKPEWHIYWKNPGESGLATSIEWFVDGKPLQAETLYPAPMTFEAPGPLTSYGYEGEVLLMAKIDTKQFEGKSAAEFSIKTSWLMCSDRCIPGKAQSALSLPVKKGEKFNTTLFAKYVSRLPGAKLPAGVKASSKIMDNKLTITIACDKPVCAQDKLPDYQRAYFFPNVYDNLDVGIPQASKADKEMETAVGKLGAYSKPFTIECQVKNRDSSNAPIKVDGVLVLPTFEPGSDKPLIHAYEISTPN